MGWVSGVGGLARCFWFCVHHKAVTTSISSPVQRLRLGKLGFQARLCRLAAPSLWAAGQTASPTGWRCVGGLPQVLAGGGSLSSSCLRQNKQSERQQRPARQNNPIISPNSVHYRRTTRSSPCSREGDSPRASVSGSRHSWQSS